MKMRGKVPARGFSPIPVFIIIIVERNKWRETKPGVISCFGTFSPFSFKKYLPTPLPLPVARRSFISMYGIFILIVYALHMCI